VKPIQSTLLEAGHKEPSETGGDTEKRPPGRERIAVVASRRLMARTRRSLPSS